MISGVTGTNFTGTQALRALHAFKTDEKIVKGAQKHLEEALVDKSFQAPKEMDLRNEISTQKAQEIKKYGELFDINISNSDINYALTYGRSVIVDYKA